MRVPADRSGSPRFSALTTLLSIRLAALACPLAGLACASGQQLQVRKVDSAVLPPSSVGLYLKISRPDGQPVRLDAEDFKVVEDGKVIPAKKLRRALLPASTAVDRFVMLVVDMSGPLVDSEYVGNVQDAIAALAEKVVKVGHVSVLAFDGDGLVPFVDFDDETVKPGMAALRKFRPRSRGIDLWGTFIESLDKLDEAGRKSKLPHRESTLVFITDWSDKAGKHTRDEAAARAKKSDAEIYVVGLGDAVKHDDLEPLGKTAALFADEMRLYKKPLGDVATRVQAKLAEDYVFAYCSPQKVARGPTRHTVEVRIAAAGWHGSVEHQFSTRAFTKEGCNPETELNFDSAEGKESDSDLEGLPTGTAASDDEAKPAKGKRNKSAKKKPKPAEDDEGGASSGTSERAAVRARTRVEASADDERDREQARDDDRPPPRAPARPPARAQAQNEDREEPPAKSRAQVNDDDSPRD